MAETFFVRLSDAGAATWGAFDATGRLVGALGRGTLQAAHAALAGRRCTALVNAVDVLAAEAALPAASQARLRQIAPFSLEESLANDVDEMAFAIGSRLPSGATQVAAVAKERMDAWLGELRAAGIVAARAVLRSRRNSRHSRDARAPHRRRTDRRPQARPGAVRVRGPAVRASVVARARAQGRRARAAAHQGLHGRRRSRALRRGARARSAVNSRAPTSSF